MRLLWGGIAAAALVGAAAPAVGGATSAQARFRAALDRLSSTPGFQLVNAVEVRAPRRESTRTDVRYRAPDRLQTIVATRLPPPAQRLNMIQVGGVRCQAPPGVCYRMARPADAVAMVRSVIGPALPVGYRAADDGHGHVVVRLSKATGRAGRYVGRLVIDARTGLPLRFSSRVIHGGRTLITQVATFRYGGPFTISLPAGAPQATG
jgi:hypothetical protein